MDANKYQEWTRSTAIYPEYAALEYLALGLASEAGEVAGKIKKIIRDGGDNITDNDIVDETMDCVWYAVRILDELGYSFEDGLKLNKAKLESRKARNVLSGSGDTR